MTERLHGRGAECAELAAEGIFAFFLESGFLAILLFGWNKVGPRMHMFSTVMVALGAHFSAIWIVVANSWMQTPAGFHVVESALRQRAEIVDFWAMVFNPSSVIRLAHTVLGVWQAAAFFVLSVSAYYLLKRKHLDFATTSMRIGLVVAVLASFGSLVTGHESALVVSKYQPAKLAAMEGHVPASSPAGLSLFGWVDEEQQRFVGVSVPGMLSYLVHGDASKPVQGVGADRSPGSPDLVQPRVRAAPPGTPRRSHCRLRTDAGAPAHPAGGLGPGSHRPHAVGSMGGGEGSPRRGAAPRSRGCDLAGELRNLVAPRRQRESRRGGVPGRPAYGFDLCRGVVQPGPRDDATGEGRRHGARPPDGARAESRRRRGDGPSRRGPLPPGEASGSRRGGPGGPPWPAT